MAVRPTGTVTFLFTDIAGSTALWENAPDATATAIARHDALLRHAVDTHHGVVFSTGGDGLAAVFERAGDAVAAAIDAQRVLRAEPWPDETPIRVRMGLHTGETHERDGDYFGPAVNRAARIMSSAAPGHVLASAVTAAVVGDLADARFVDVGSHRLKGLSEPTPLLAVQADGLDTTTRAVRTERTLKGNLRTPVTEFVGRLDQLRHRAAVLPSRRVVTLTGPGGVGKTRYATEVAWLLVDEYPGGIWTVELGPITDPAAVIPTVASTLGAMPQPGLTMLDSIVDWLRDRRALVVLDNCEHVLDQAAELVVAIARDCPGTTVLATSREPLGVPGEQVVRIPSLSPVAAVELFVTRARAADDTTAFDDADRATIDAVCRRLDGIPLAIELAASRTRAMSVADLAARLDDRFRLLRGAGRGGLERHQTLQATVTWSYQLLHPDERLLFDRLSVFAGSFDLHAAEQVCSDDELASFQFADLLPSLVDKSMVVADRTVSPTRYRLLETLRQYAEDQLDQRGETGALRDRHLAHYSTVARETYEDIYTAADLEATAVFDLEWDNLRTAHFWACTIGDVSSADRLLLYASPYAFDRMLTEHRDWTRRSIVAAQHASAANNPYTANFKVSWAILAGDFVEAIEDAQEAIAASPDRRHPATLVNATHLASAASAIGDKELYRNAVAHALEGPEPGDIRLACIWLSALSRLAPRDLAHASADRIAALARQTGSVRISVVASSARAFASLFSRPNDAGQAYLVAVSGFDLARSARRIQEGWMLAQVAAIAAAVLDRPEAAPWCEQAFELSSEHRLKAVFSRLFTAAAATLRRLGHPHEADALHGYVDALPAPIRNIDIDDQPTRGVDYDHGAAMSRDEAIAFALAALRSLHGAE